MIFMVTSVSLTIIQGKGGDVGLSDRLKQVQQNKAASPEAKGPHGSAASSQAGEGEGGSAASNRPVSE